MLFAFLIGTAFAVQDVSLKTQDGLTLHARGQKVKGASKGVVMVHMLGRDAVDWDFTAGQLVDDGFTVVAPDLRGHGKSPQSGQELAQTDYLNMLHDVNAAVDWLRSQGVTEVSCMGADLGANLCLQAAAEEPAVVNLVLLSPSLNTKGILSPPALKGYGNRPILLVASDEDQPAAHAASLLVSRAQGQAHLELLTDAGHGTTMLNRDGSLEGLVQRWLLGTYQFGTGEIVVPRPGMNVDTAQIETEGQKLQSHE